MKTIIMAGGKGTRVAPIAPDIPKPMLPLCGKPILAYQIESLVRSGLQDILIITGHLGTVISDYFGDGRRYGAHISYYQEREPLGTAGALFRCQEHIDNAVVLINGDILFDIDFKRLITYHEEKERLATLVTHPNSHPYDSALVMVDRENRISKWLGKEDERSYYHNLVNAGIHIITKALLDRASAHIGGSAVDLDRDILKPQLGSGGIYSYKSPEYIKDIGTPDRYYAVEKDICAGRVSARNLTKPQRAVFLDRDGTINKMNGFISRPEDFELVEGAAEAIRAINEHGYLVIVVTNQPVIARGACSEEELDMIHQKMEGELGKGGAYIDDLFYCPHHPDKGFPGERAEYKGECTCRKPKPGMLLRAAEQYHIDLSESWMVGDEERDIQAGKNAGCKTILLKQPGRLLLDELDLILHPAQWTR